MNLNILFQRILSLSFMGSILAGILFLIKWVFKEKFSSKWHYYIWLLLIIRLTIPYTPESSISIFNIVPLTFEETWSSQNNTMFFNLNIPSKQFNNTNPSCLQKDLMRNQNALKEQKNDSKFNYTLASKIWMFGILAVISYIVFVNMRYALKLKKQVKCEDKEVLKIFEECKYEMNINCSIPLIYDENLKSPSLFGLLRPKIVLSHEVTELTENEKRYVFLHELTHLKRKDILINWVKILVQAIHWFNPIIWYVFYKMKEDCELACDAYVLSHINSVEHKRYGETIIKLATKSFIPYWCPSTTGFVNNKSNLEKRIKMISKFKKTSWKWGVLSIVVLVIVSCVGLTNGKGYASKISDKQSKSILKDSETVHIKAVYFVAKKGGELSEEDIKAHPEVVVVNDFDELESILKDNPNISIWIDKNVAEFMDGKWLDEKPQRTCTQVLVGYNNGVYSFRDVLGTIRHKSRRIDSSEKRLEPGSSYRKLQVDQKTGNELSLIAGSDDIPTVEKIFDLIDCVEKEGIESSGDEGIKKNETIVFFISLIDENREILNSYK